MGHGKIATGGGSGGRNTTIVSIGGFVRDFAAYSGRIGVVAAALVAAGAILEGVGLALLIPLLGVVTGAEGAIPGGGAMFAALGVASPTAQLVLLLALFGVLMVIRAVIISARDTVLASLCARFMEARRISLAARLANARWDQLSNLRHARISHVMSADFHRVGQAATALMFALVSAALLATLFLLALILAPFLALGAFAAFTLSALWLGPALRRAQDTGRANTEAQLTILDTTGQFLGGLKEAMSQNLQGRYLLEFRQTLNTLSGQYVDFIRLQTNAQLMMTTLLAAIAAAVVLVGFSVTETPAPELMTLLVVFARMSGPTVRLQQGLQEVVHGVPAHRAMVELEDDLATIERPEAETAAGEARAAPSGAIAFHDVSFSHDGAPEAGVRDLSLTIPQGQILGVSGPSGAGKTTFADLLAGLYAPLGGEITVGGEALSGPALAAWRGKIAYVSQDPFVFYDSVRGNLAWANPDATEDDIWAALEAADAAEFVRNLDGGLDAVLGERGALISGGQRQRIAIARAVLRRPALLILDEATSSIDIAGEQTILDRLAALTPKPTMVIVAHRPQSLSLCRRVLHFDAGRIVEDEALTPARSA